MIVAESAQGVGLQNDTVYNHATLKSRMLEKAKVMRDGELKKLPIRNLIPDEVIDLNEGDRVPADAYLIDAYNLWTNNTFYQLDHIRHELKTEVSS